MFPKVVELSSSIWNYELNGLAPSETVKCLVGIFWKSNSISSLRMKVFTDSE